MKSDLREVEEIKDVEAEEVRCKRAFLFAAAGDEPNFYQCAAQNSLLLFRIWRVWEKKSGEEREVERKKETKIYIPILSTNGEGDKSLFLLLLLSCPSSTSCPFSRAASISISAPLPKI